MSVIIDSNDVNRWLRNYHSKAKTMIVSKRKKNKFHVLEGRINYQITLKTDGIICSCSPEWCIHRIKVILCSLNIPELYLYFYTPENWKQLIENNFSSTFVQDIVNSYLYHECPICFEELTRPKKGEIILYQCHECRKLTCQKCIKQWTDIKSKKYDIHKTISCPHCRTEKPPDLPI